MAKPFIVTVNTQFKTYLPVDSDRAYESTTVDGRVKEQIRLWKESPEDLFIILLESSDFYSLNIAVEPDPDI